MAEARDIAAIVLAAGASRRFGTDKLLYPLALQGVTQPLAVHGLRPWLAVFDAVTVVARPQSSLLRDTLGQVYGNSIDWVECAQAELGMGHSLAAGVAANAGASGWLIGLADMPVVPPAAIAGVRDALAAGAPLAAPYCNGRRGHPVGFSAAYRDALLAPRGDQGARGLLQRDQALIWEIASSASGIFADVDTRADLPAIYRKDDLP